MGNTVVRNTVIGRYLTILAVLLLSLGASPAVLAQTNAEANAGIQFNLSLPGARSLAMGGAFIGLADDATAAFTNPAGLTNISAPEISIEGRSWDFTNSFSDIGVVDFATNPPDFSQLELGEASSETDGLSFLSYVYPKKRWVFALYRHELANFESGFSNRLLIFGNSNSIVPLRPIRATMDLKIESLGLAIAVRLNESLSLGLGLTHYEFEWASLSERFELNQDLTISPNLANSQEILGDDSNTGVNLGLLWKMSESWQLGLVYRDGPGFDFATVSRGPNGTVGHEDDGVFRTPDVYGVGLAYSRGGLKLLLDVVRVTYSDLTVSTINVVNDNPLDNESAANITTDDGTEVHLGFEYLFSQMKVPLALRFGVSHDPDHQAAYRGPLVNESQQTEAVLFRPGDDEIHYSAGFGLTFKEGRIEVNTAADFSDRVDTLSLSAVFRFF